MELKLVRTELNNKPRQTTMQKLLSEAEKSKESVFYFDKTNAHKDLLEVVNKFEEEGYSVYFREIRYGLDKDDYMYQLHIL
jgi:hypothetical protein